MKLNQYDINIDGVTYAAGTLYIGSDYDSTVYATNSEIDKAIENGNWSANGKLMDSNN
jgi:hypothetical protein